MAFKPNYNQQRAERARSKAQKKQEKLQRKVGDAPPAEDGDEPETEEEGSAET